MKPHPVRLRFIALGALLALALPAGHAFAKCAIHNDTKYSFTVESGNVSNQQVSAHSQTSIAHGKIIGKSRDGKSFGGFCKDGDSLEIKEEKGVVILQPK